MQEQLFNLYISFFRSAAVPAALDSRLSCPLLLSVGPRWEGAARRLLVVGQETHGWDWKSGDYYPWPHPPLKTLADFKAYDGGIQALMNGYPAFAFSKYQPANFNSPFWRAFRLFVEGISDEGDADALWTNLFRCDLDGSSVKDTASPIEFKDILKFQQGLLTREIAVLQPTAVLFLTGPNYDRALTDEFSGITIHPALGHSARELAQLGHPSLPTASYRTYHPNYLARDSGRWSWLNELISYIKPVAP